MPLAPPERTTPATIAGGPAPGWRARLQSPAAARLLLWYVLLLVPTLFFKYSYLRSVATDGLAATLASGPFGHLPGVVQYLLLFKGDLAEVLVIVLIAAIAGRLLRLDLAWLVALSSFIAIMVSAANWLSFQTAGALIARDNLTLAVAWIRQNPLVLLAQPSDRLLVMAGVLMLFLAALWSLSAFLLARYAVAGGRGRIVVRTLGPVIGTVWIAGLVAAVAYRTHGAPVPESFRGYWSETAGSLAGFESWHPDALHLPSVARIDSEYDRLVYPAPRDARSVAPVAAPLIHPRPAHIVVISLETAPHRYYPITDNSAYPAFFAMEKQGIVTDHHFTTMPATMWAIYSMVSGTYPRLGRSLVDYGDFHAGGLAAVLGSHGYETTFIDSYRVDWNPSNGGHHNSRLLRGLGFSTLLEAAPDAGAAETAGSADQGYAAAVAQERRSLSSAADRIGAASAHGAKAFVFVATILGHYPWRTPPGAEGLGNDQKIPLIARDLDRCVGEFLQSLRDRGLADSVIVVVTGDHGLRTMAEFRSVGQPMELGPISFNVPLLIYAPGIITSAIHIPFVTSHVDLAPTLLALVGIHDAPLLLEGGNMLDGTPCGRTTFLLNGSLRPVDGYYRAGRFYALNRFTGDVRMTPGPPDPCASDAAPGATPGTGWSTASDAATAAATSRTLDQASQLFDTTAAIFLRQSGPGRDGMGVLDQSRVAH
ncbi:MAG: LTA synthase family protein [Gemmatimonadales bacterium]